MKKLVKKKRGRKVPDGIIAARIAMRDMERETLGDGFHARTRAVRNKKRYSRKAKHPKSVEE
ncbi:MAG: hypothetical protein IJR13_03090 [Bacteroidales bacterium]|nr:hypothetical protein [Bacteroidales bacterium]